MSNKLGKVDSSDISTPWGNAHPKRGAGYEDAARAFVDEFPVGSTLSAEDFDNWAQHAGHLKIPVSVKKQSDAWLAHLQRRHQLRYNINLAGSHPRMEDRSFVIEAIGQGTWEVRAPHVAISRNKMLQRIESLTVTRRKQLSYLMQSADFAALPPHERIIAESLFDDIDMFEEQVEVQSRRLGNKFAKLERAVRKAVEKGNIRDSNGGIKAILGK